MLLQAHRETVTNSTTAHIAIFRRETSIFFI